MSTPHPRLTLPLALAPALLTLATLGGAAEAGPIPFQSDGVVAQSQPPGGEPVAVAFWGTSGTVPEAGRFRIGDLIVRSRTDGVDATYDNASFQIALRAPQLDFNTQGPANLFGSTMTHHLAGLLISGHLSGKVNASGSYDLTATIDSIAPGTIGPRIPEDSYLTFFPIDPTRLILPPTMHFVGPTPGGIEVYGQIAPVPEPATGLVVLLGVAALGLRRRSRVPAMRGGGA